jgi:phosphoribosyl 1,2-cyclic phosphodiesterase
VTEFASAPAFIKFLGTAGARFVVAKQLRASGGIFLSAKGERLIIDPGPGTLVKCAASRPPIDASALTAVVLTHAHIDHSNDVNVLIDAMTYGGIRKRGKLFAPAECLEGENAVVLRYVRKYLEDVVVLEASHKYSVGELTFATSVRHQHSTETYGLKFQLDGENVSFLVDTKFFPGLLKSYRNSDTLVINVVRETPFEKAEIMHLSLEDAKKIIVAIRPRRAILTHFGMTMLKAKPWELAKALEQELGIEVTAASDGLRIDFGGEE